MISRTVTFTDFNEKSVTKTFWFHLSRDTVFDNLDLEEQFEELEKQFGGDKRELTKDDIVEILKLVKRLFRLSYGERSENGERFKAGVDYPEVWDDFKTSADYDAVLWDLFTHPKDLFPFLNGIMPKDLRDEAKERTEELERRKQPQDHLPKHTSRREVADDDEPVTNVFETVPSEVVETPENLDSLDEVRPLDETIEERRARLQREMDALG